MADKTAEERIAAARAARAALRAERDAAAAERADEEAAAHEERALKDEQAIVAAEKQHGKQGEKIYVVTGVNAKECDLVIVKRPNAVAFKAFQDLEKASVLDFEKLVAPCVVYPDLGTFDRLISLEQPGLLLRAAKGVSYLAGVRMNEDTGKA